MPGPTIVQLVVSQQIAPLPATLQRMGAICSHGSTVLTPGTTSYLTQLSDLTPLLRPSASIQSLAWAGGIVTVTTVAPHGIAAHAPITISGAVPAAYNGVYYATSTGLTTFTYQLANNPGSATTSGFWNVSNQPELISMATTWFSQGVLIGCFVLELGVGSALDGVNALAAYLALNPNTSFTSGAQGYNYAYLVPRSFDRSNFSPAASAAFLALVSQYESTTAKTYFFTTTTLSSYTQYLPTMKSIFWEIESPQMAQYPTVGLASMSQTGGTVTGSTIAAHGVVVGDWFQLQGNTPTGYNGWWQAQSGTGGSVLVFNNPTGSLVPATTLGFLVASQATNAGIASNEFSCAASMYDVISNNPSSSNKVPPLNWNFQFGVTPWPTQGLGATLQAIQTAGGNFVTTGSEGGISTATITLGQTADGNDFLYWYSVDAAQLFGDENLSNTVINGNNNRLNPLYYSQGGISRLQDSMYQTIVSLASWGLANGTQIINTQFPASSLPGSPVMSLTEALDSGDFAGMILINAEPYLAYLTENPSDYRLERYAGISVVYIPSTGFRQVILNYLVTQLITSGAGLPTAVLATQQF